jgi:hypothetical protein
MPTDVDLFDMRRRNVLEAMTDEELEAELRRAQKMAEAVRDYQDLISIIMASRPV